MSGVPRYDGGMKIELRTAMAGKKASTKDDGDDSLGCNPAVNPVHSRADKAL